MTAFRKTWAFALILPAMLAGRAMADEAPADVSLAKEIDQYLAAAAPEGGDPNVMTVTWNNGFTAKSADGAHSIHIGGRVMADSSWTSSDDYDADVTEDSTFFRRLRIELGGTIFKNIGYALQVDFAKAAYELKDVFVEIKDVPFVGMIRFGHFKEPIGLEELTSSKYITFMERSTVINAFAPAHNMGIAVGNNALDKRLDWMAGVFRDTDVNGIQTQDGGYNVSVRISGIVMEDKEKGLLIHIGISGSLRSPHDDEARFRARPDRGDGPRLVDTGTIDTEEYTLFGFEFAVVWKSLSAQAEYIMADVDAPADGDPTFSGVYIMVSYWITGESRPYKGGTFGRVKPKKNFLRGDGMGAWEVAVRWGLLDLSDGSIIGGELTTITIGVNWHLNPNTRIMFNFVMADEETDGELIVFESRIQVDF